MSSTNKFLKKLKDLEEREKIRNQRALADVYDEVGAKGVASQIRQGKEVRANVEYGFIHTVHDKIGPRYNVETKKVVPQTKKAREIEHGWIDNVNILLKNSGEKPLDKAALLKKIRSEDRAWEKKLKNRR